jgi:hypothetical protein
MPQVETINFVDRDSGQPGFAAVGVADDVVGVAFSLQNDGDIEIFLDARDVHQLARALERAGTLATGAPPG